ncbi:MAG TPA: exonuclease domain-containing protein [Gaiellaceae bacterium]|nr:exonuclease domain-containing protein [Gaiellaceae bacterium]
MQLRLDAADRLVELVEERRGPVVAEEAAAKLFALRQAPVALARSLLAEVVEADARLAWSGDAVGLARPLGEDLLLEEATYVVVDLETTGLRPGESGICEIGAVRVRGLELAEEFETLVNPGRPIAAAASALTGLRDAQLRKAPPPATAVRRFLEFAGDAVLVAHNARFDLAFLDRETERLTGSRLAAPVLDTVGLARRLLAGRVPRASLAQLAHFVGTSAQPCHRALPDAQATAEVLLTLIGLAQERGARTVADLARLGATRTRRVFDKRHLAHGAPSRPGVYLWRDRNGQVLYVGRARDLRARLRSYFRSDRQRPAVEAALGAVERIEWRVLGSELEAALEELRLIGELRPPANARVARTDRYVWLKRRGDGVVCSAAPASNSLLQGPLRSRRLAQTAARALRTDELERPAAALPRLRRKLAHLSEQRRFEDAARLRDRIEALERVCRELARTERLRALERCVLVPAAEPGHVRAYFVAGGTIAAERTLPPGGGAALEVEAGLAAARRARLSNSLLLASLEEVLLLGAFLRKPPPELRAAPLERDAILRAAAAVARAHARPQPPKQASSLF